MNIEPGDYLVEMELGGEIAKEDLLAGLARIGWQGPPDDPDRLPIDGPVPDVFTGLVRFVGALRQTIVLHDTPLVRWTFVHRATFPVFNSFRFTFRMFPLRRAQRYEMRFLVRMRTAPTRDAVAALLEKMGFQVEKISLLKKDMRLPDRPGSQISHWYGIGRWSLASAYVVEDDPLFFEDLAALPSGEVLERSDALALATEPVEIKDAG